MSKRTEPTGAEACVALGATEPRLESYPARELRLGSLVVSRALPVRDRRLVGPWCFLDRFGPLTFSDGQPIDVAPHPHIGLQTVTWLLDGEVIHDDSLGCEGLLRPGGVNVMTAGAGIAHAEQTPRDNSGRLDGVQLWAALPDSDRSGPARFEQATVPGIESPGGIIHAFAGAFQDVPSPATHYSDLLGADLRVHPRHTLEVPLNPAHEHAVLVLRGGDCRLDDQRLEPGLLHYLGTARTQTRFSSRDGAHLLLLGGPPFDETILMWWNFVARTPEEIATARADWEAHRRFGEVHAYAGPRLAAPDLGRLARPDPAS